jgi:hypothetical protein
LNSTAHPGPAGGSPGVASIGATNPGIPGGGLVSGTAGR